MHVNVNAKPFFILKQLFGMVSWVGSPVLCSSTYFCDKFLSISFNRLRHQTPDSRKSILAF